MAIIRIKRTTSTNLPTGLTFGELAFIGATGGLTANRLYIAGPQGVCVWIGAEILNSPTYWSGVTAQTTVPTVSAVSDIAAAFAGITTFSSNITANLSTGKYFGKYGNGQLIQSAGKSAVEVILDALIESIAPSTTFSLTSFNGLCASNSTYYGTPFGATAMRTILSWGYTINTPGKTALGATLSWRINAGAWTTLSTSVYDQTSPFWTQADGATTQSYTHTFTQTQYSTDSLTYRYEFHDSSGSAVAEKTFTQTQGYGTPSISGIVVNAISGIDNITRERGNTGTTFSCTVSGNNNDVFIRMNAYAVDYRVNGSGNWRNAANNNENDNTFTSVTPTGTISISNIAVKPTVSPIDKLDFRVRVKDSYSTGAAGVVASNQQTVQFYKRLWYGATSDVPANAAQIRTLPAYTQLSYNDTASRTNQQFTFGTGTTYRHFVIALPAGLTLNDGSWGENLEGVRNITTPQVLYGNPNPASDDFKLSTTLTVADDFSGTDINYNVYVYSASVPYSEVQGSQTFRVTYGGSLNNTT